MDFNDLARRMDGAVDVFVNELKGLRTGRASASLVENVNVDAYGNQMPLNQLGSISVPEPRMITVQVWDQSMVQSVEKAVANAGLGLNPSSDGQLVRIPLPELTEDRRKELVKVAHQYAEKARVAIRNVRRDGMDQLKKEEKDGEISQDEQHTEADKVQKLTDGHVEKVDEILKKKEDEILSV